MSSNRNQKPCLGTRAQRSIKTYCYSFAYPVNCRTSFGSMDLQPENASPVFAEAASLTTSRLGTCSSLLPYSPRFPLALLMIPMKDPNWEFASAEDDNVGHSALTCRYPSALESFEKIIKCAKEKRMALFLDYDGTLSPIVDDPDNAVMSSAVYEFVGLSELYYVGSHGMDIMGPGRQSDPCKYTDIVTPAEEQSKDKRFQPADEFLPMINEACLPHGFVAIAYLNVNSPSITTCRYSGPSPSLCQKSKEQKLRTTSSVSLCIIVTLMRRVGVQLLSVFMIF